jgi:hypothetical protein
VGVEYHVELECEHAAGTVIRSVKAHCLGAIALYEDACSSQQEAINFSLAFRFMCGLGA